jgi:hypothetical protein
MLDAWRGPPSRLIRVPVSLLTAGTRIRSKASSAGATEVQCVRELRPDVSACLSLARSGPNAEHCTEGATAEHEVEAGIKGCQVCGASRRGLVPSLRLSGQTAAGLVKLGLPRGQLVDRAAADRHLINLPHWGVRVRLAELEGG